MPYGWAAAAAAVGGALISSDASSSATNKQGAATDKAVNATTNQFNVTRADSAPYRTAGGQAMNSLSGLLGIGPKSGGPLTPEQVQQVYQRYMGRNVLQEEMQNVLATNQTASGLERAIAASPEHQYHLTEGRVSPVAAPLFAPENAGADGATPGGGQYGDLQRKFSVNDFWQDPVVQLDYQSGLDLGTKALKNAAPLTTGADSGAAMKELTKFGTDYTGQQAGAAQTRFEANKTNVYNRLMGLITGGQTANAVDANTGTAAATTNANMLSAQGNARAASTIAQGNAYAGGINSISNWWQQKSMMDQMSNNGVGNGYYGGAGPYNQSRAIQNSSMYGY